MNPSKPQYKDLAAALGVVKSRITAMAKAGMPTHSVEAAREWYGANLDPARRKHGRQPPPWNESRARREAAEAELAELKLAEQRGELIRVGVIRSAWARRITTMRDALLQVPDRLCQVLAAETDPEVVHARLQAELVRLMEDAAGIETAAD